MLEQYYAVLRCIANSFFLLLIVRKCAIVRRTNVNMTKCANESRQRVVPKKVRTSISLTEEVYDRAIEAARSEKRTFSNWLEVLITEKLAEPEKVESDE